MSQLGQINLGFPSGYGFTAIIVSFLGRLHPVGVFIAGLILAVTYVGGQVAQTVVHVPEATAGIFQAMMLFFILASDILVRYRLRIVRDAPRGRNRGGAGVNIGFFIDAIVTVIGVTTPILLAATGELVVEKSGVLNLGVEGMMLIGAITGFAVAFNYGDSLGDWAPWVGVIAAGLGGRGVLDAVRRARADARLQSGRDRPCADDLRHRSLLADRRRLCRHGHPAFQPDCSRTRSPATHSGGCFSAIARSSISR